MADTLRADLGALPGLSEQKMFGGICFMLHGNMVCGTGPMGALFRTGKEALKDALALDGVRQMQMGARRMGGFVQVDDACFDDEDLRSRLLNMALAFAGSLPAKGKAAKDGKTRGMRPIDETDRAYGKTEII